MGEIMTTNVMIEVESMSSEMDVDEAAMREDIAEVVDYNEDMGEMSATNIVEELIGPTVVKSTPLEMGLSKVGISGDDVEAEPWATEIGSLLISSNDKMYVLQIKNTMKDHEELLEICSNIVREVIN